MRPPVFVVDTNVVVAGLVTGSSRSPVAWVVDAMLSGTLVCLLSPALLDEYRSVQSSVISPGAWLNDFFSS